MGYFASGLRPEVLLFLLLLPAAAFAQRLTWAEFTSQYSSQCSGRATDTCTVPAGVKVAIRTSVKVRSMWILGDVLVQPRPGGITIDAAFIVAKGQGSKFSVNSTTWDQTVTIYLRRNPQAYGDIPANTLEDAMLGGGRVLAAWQGGKVHIQGLPMRRTWTLLTQDVMAGATSICVADDVRDWPRGMVIALSPTDATYNMWADPVTLGQGQRVGAQQFVIDDIIPGSGTPCCAAGPACTSFLIKLRGSVDHTKYDPSKPSSYITDVPVYQGSQPPIQGEVLFLNRTVIITGDDFTARYKASNHPPWPNPAKGSNGNWPTPWSPWADSPFPGEGLHTLAVGLCDSRGANCQSNGGWMRVHYARVEKGGQRGWIGRYPLHLHKMGNCPGCRLTGNVVMNSQQRGITIHSTHRSLVHNNVVFAVKGAGIYVEEGTEMANVIKENAVVCDVGVASYTKKVNGIWVDAGLKDSGQGTQHGGGGCQADSALDFGDPSVELGGCRITGTDNEQADCAQQAGIWALSTSNDFIGNRVSNHYNGIYFQSTLFKAGRLGTDSLDRVCPIHSAWGKMQGNVVHSNQRFGFYPDVNYPNDLKRSPDTSNGYVSDISSECTGNLTNFSPGAVCSCRPYSLPNGDSNAQPVTMYEDGIDWGNGFVGQYDLADVQYKNFTSFQNNWGMYWKGGKNFRNYTASLIKDSVFSFMTRKNWAQQCCGDKPGPCKPAYQAYWLSYWNFAGDAATSLLSLPGASATLILENVTLRGSPGNADWITRGKRNGGQGAALNINQQCKFFKGLVNPFGDLGYDEGALCTPQVYLDKVTFDIFECGQDLGPGQPANLPVWINIGAANGNSYLGMVVAADDSLCGGKLSPCPIRAVVSNYSTHLLDLPGNPCEVTVNLTAAQAPAARWHQEWFIRFTGHMICTKQTRRFNIWGPDQGPLVLMPPGGKRAWDMHWLGFGIPGTCWGTQCAEDEERRWAEGYGATVMSSQELPGVWKLSRADGQPVDLSLIRMIEFSDQAFGSRYPEDNMQLQIDNLPVCWLSSKDNRAWMTQFGPVRRGGGSCYDLLSRVPMKGQ